MINKYWYRVKRYDSYNDEEKISEGYAFGSTFIKAAEEIAKMYGKDGSFIRLDIKWVDDTDCYIHEENERISTSGDDF
jgi:hypothetical protein